MDFKIAAPPRGKRARPGFVEMCLMLCVVFSAMTPACAQQDAASTSLLQAGAGLSNSSSGQPTKTLPAMAPLLFPHAQPAVVLAPSKPEISAYSPMTRQQRWQDFKDTNFDSSGAFFQTFFTSLGDFTGNAPQWDSGMAGFSEHFASDFGRFTIGGTIHSSLAAVLHQDTRYFPCHCRGGLHRTLHALGRMVFTYGDDGRIYPDVSGLAGIYGGSMLMTEWYPAKYTPFGYGVRQGNIGAGVTATIYVIREFSPEIKRAFHRRMANQT